MSLLIIAFSQADSKATVNSYNIGSGKEGQNFYVDSPQKESTGSGDNRIETHQHPNTGQANASIVL